MAETLDRLAVKIGTDSAAAAIPTDAPTLIPLQELLRLERPSELPPTTTPAAAQNTRYRPAETTLYTLDVDIYRYSQDRYSQDRQCVFRQHGDSPSSRRQMFGVLPAVEKTPRSSVWRRQIVQARIAFEQQFPNPSGFCHVHARITGIGFFDTLHGKSTGEPANGISLHPILAITFPDSPAPEFPAWPARPPALQQDPRLNRAVTLNLPQTTLARALQAVTAQTGVKLRVEGRKLGELPISLRYQGVPAGDILASLASLRNLEWMPQADGALALRLKDFAPIPDLLLPQTLAEIETARRGKVFVEQLSRQPESVRKSLMDSTDSDAPGLRYDQLPPVLQKSILALFAPQLPQTTPEGSAAILRSEVPSTRIYLKIDRPNPSYTGYQIDMTRREVGRYAALSTIFRLFRTHSEVDYDFVPQSGWQYGNGFMTRVPFPLDMWRPQLLLTPGGSPSLRRGVLARAALDPQSTLERRVTLRLPKATFVQALDALAQQAPIGFVAEYWAPVPVAQPVLLEDIPLQEALERLEKQYAFVVPESPVPFRYGPHWSETAEGLFVFHLVPDRSLPVSAEKAASK